VRPHYRSGTVVHVGESVSAFVSGILLNPSGEPASLQAGEIVALEETKSAPISVFTNRRGKFTADGLQGGRYELRLFGDANARVAFEIAQGTVGQHELGTLRLPVRVTQNPTLQ
jgi:outer membrane usher protein